MPARPPKVSPKLSRATLTLTYEDRDGARREDYITAQAIHTGFSSGGTKVYSGKVTRQSQNGVEYLVEYHVSLKETP